MTGRKHLKNTGRKHLKNTRTPRPGTWPCEGAVEADQIINAGGEHTQGDDNIQGGDDNIQGDDNTEGDDIQDQS